MCHIHGQKQIEARMIAGFIEKESDFKPGTGRSRFKGFSADAKRRLTFAPARSS
jgi:hypothetical protein